MKLYEFVFRDHMNLSEAEVLALVQKAMEDEAEIKGWLPGYTFSQYRSSEQLANGEKEYFFLVEGEI